MVSSDCQNKLIYIRKKALPAAVLIPEYISIKTCKTALLSFLSFNNGIITLQNYNLLHILGYKLFVLHELLVIILVWQNIRQFSNCKRFQAT